MGRIFSLTAEGPMNLRINRTVIVNDESLSKAAIVIRVFGDDSLVSNDSRIEITELMLPHAESRPVQIMTSKDVTPEVHALSEWADRERIVASRKLVYA